MVLKQVVSIDKEKPFLKLLSNELTSRIVLILIDCNFYGKLFSFISVLVLKKN